MTTPTPTRKARVTAVAEAVLAALAVWALAEGVFGVDVRAPANGGQASYDIGPALVAVTSGLAALAGWGLLTALEHFAARARAIWTAVASLVLVGSLAGPLFRQRDHRRQPSNTAGHARRGWRGVGPRNAPDGS